MGTQEVVVPAGQRAAHQVRHLRVPRPPCPQARVPPSVDHPHQRRRAAERSELQPAHARSQSGCRSTWTARSSPTWPSASPKCLLRWPLGPSKLWKPPNNGFPAKPGEKDRPAGLGTRAPSPTMIREIAGHQNHSVKLARKLQQKKFRRERGLLVGEGMDLLVAAVAGGADVREILVRRELLSEVPAGLREQAAAFSGPGKPGARRRGFSLCGRGHRCLQPGDPRSRQFSRRLGGRHLHLSAAAGPAGGYRPRRGVGLLSGRGRGSGQRGHAGSERCRLRPGRSDLLAGHARTRGAPRP